MSAPSPARRRLLKALAAAPLAAAWPTVAAVPAPNRLLVMVFLYGGNDGYNTWVPYADDLYYKLRPTIAVPRDTVLKITERHGFHPSLASLLPAWEAKELAVVQGLGYAQGTQQHYRDIDTAFTACDGLEYSSDGWITRALARRAGAGAAADAVAFDVLDIRQVDPMGPFRGDKLGVVQVYYPEDLLNSRSLSAHVHDANTLGRALLAKASPPYAPVTLSTPFPGDHFGNAMRATVELARLEPSLPVIHVALNGLDGDKHHSVDCHWDQLKHHGAALRRLARDRALGRDAGGDLRRVRPLPHGEPGPRDAPWPRDDALRDGRPREGGPLWRGATRGAHAPDRRPCPGNRYQEALGHGGAGLVERGRRGPLHAAPRAARPAARLTTSSGSPAAPRQR